jgi:hypothetical protein
MTIQLSIAVRNGCLDSMESTIGVSAVIRLYSGVQPANCAASETGTLLAEFDLASDWAAAAANGSKTLNNLPLTTMGLAGAGTGTAVGHYRIYESTKTTCHEQGSITINGGGGDMIVDNISIATGQTVNITGKTQTAGNP